MFDTAPTTADIKFKAPPIENFKINNPIVATGDAMWGMNELRNSQEKSGNWQAQMILDKELGRINDNLKSTDTKVTEDAVKDAVDLRQAVREGGSALNHFIESRSDRIESSFEQAHQKADAKPKESEGQTAAIDLIVAESESIKHELSDEMTPDKSGKLQKLAGFAAMLEGVAGDNAKGLKQLKIWLEEKTTEVAKAVELKEQEYGLNLDTAKQIIESQTDKPVPLPENQATFQKAKDLVDTSKKTEEQKIQLDSATKWASAKSTP